MVDDFGEEIPDYLGSHVIDSGTKAERDAYNRAYLQRK